MEVQEDVSLSVVFAPLDYIVGSMGSSHASSY